MRWGARLNSATPACIVEQPGCGGGWNAKLSAFTSAIRCDAVVSLFIAAVATLWLPALIWLLLDHQWEAAACFGLRLPPVCLRYWYGSTLYVPCLLLISAGDLCRIAFSRPRCAGRGYRSARVVEGTPGLAKELRWCLGLMADTTSDILADIAILDDDLDFRNYLEDFLKDEGSYTVRAFARPVELFQGCEEQVPDIVLLDMKMGDATGDKVLEQLLARWPNLCAIVVTGYPSLEDMRVTFKLKVFDYLAKPFSLAQLRQVLKNAVEAFGLGRTPQDRLRERLGHSIKLLRVSRDWSLKDLATHTKLSVSQISAIERGANLPSIESFLAIARAFDKKPSEILSSIDF